MALGYADGVFEQTGSASPYVFTPVPLYARCRACRDSGWVIEVDANRYTTYWTQCACQTQVCSIVRPLQDWSLA